MIRFGHEVCHDLAAATEREWLDTNLAADAMRWGIFWCVEPRYAAAIAEGADADGLNVGDVA